LAAAYRGGDLKAGTELARAFFKRVNSKADWSRTGFQEAKIINDLRILVREHISFLRKRPS